MNYKIGENIMLDKYFLLKDFAEAQKRVGVDPTDREAWVNFTRAAKELERVLSGTGRITSHALILNNIQYHIKPLIERLDSLDVIYQWRSKMDERRAKRDSLISSQEESNEKYPEVL